MEEENLTYRKCCTAPFTPDRHQVIASESITRRQGDRTDPSKRSNATIFR
jgi:hypothetical protein